MGQSVTFHAEDFAVRKRRFTAETTRAAMMGVGRLERDVPLAALTAIVAFHEAYGSHGIPDARAMPTFAGSGTSNDAGLLPDHRKASHIRNSQS